MQCYYLINCFLKRKKIKWIFFGWRGISLINIKIKESKLEKPNQKYHNPKKVSAWGGLGRKGSWGENNGLKNKEEKDDAAN